ncbi:MAG: LysE family transporter [Oscillospiraceae bacterium]
MFSWSAFLTYVVITAITPGPNNLMSLSNASRVGFRRAMPFNLGMATGLSLLMVLCTLFCSLLSSLIPKIKLPMLILGAIYMLHLAWKIFNSSSELEEKTGEYTFLQGFVLQFVNVKLYLYGILSMEVYILPYFAGQTGVLIGFALLLAAVCFCSICSWSAFGSVFRLLFSKYAKVTNTIMALLLVYCAVALFF